MTTGLSTWYHIRAFIYQIRHRISRCHYTHLQNLPRILVLVQDRLDIDMFTRFGSLYDHVLSWSWSYYHIHVIYHSWYYPWKILQRVLPNQMSGTGAKFSIFPTRMALTTMKNRLKGAQTGHSLLKRKSEALTRRFREIVAKIDAVELFN